MQGFEHDWNGVILGPDLVWREDGWVVQRRENRDPDFRNSKRVTDAEVEHLITNVYKVVLTRGMVGTLLYSVDDETLAHLIKLSGRRSVHTALPRQAMNASTPDEGERPGSVDVQLTEAETVMTVRGARLTDHEGHPLID